MSWAWWCARKRADLFFKSDYFGLNFGEGVGDEILARVAIRYGGAVGDFPDEFGENLSRDDLSRSVHDDGVDVELEIRAERGRGRGEGRVEQRKIGGSLLEFVLCQRFARCARCGDSPCPFAGALRCSPANSPLSCEIGGKKECDSISAPNSPRATRRSVPGSSYRPFRLIRCFRFSI